MKANIPDEKQNSYSLSELTERVGVRFYKAFYESEIASTFYLFWVAEEKYHKTLQEFTNLVKANQQD
ncbi:MAG: hypothetical protein V7K14_30490 [Nostoc sp.]|uniref:hypothetical protein n=1 Tax=Nostoc sp. TaxID=1180 RepID=UPI002FF70CC1